MGHHLLDYDVGYHYPTSIIPRHTRCGLPASDMKTTSWRKPTYLFSHVSPVYRPISCVCSLDSRHLRLQADSALGQPTSSCHLRSWTRWNLLLRQQWNLGTRTWVVEGPRQWQYVLDKRAVGKGI